MSDSNKITRKGFLESSTAGLVGLLGANRVQAAGLRTLGNTGLKVFPLGFGASRTMEPALLKTALDAGVNFVDTGNYFNGQNEVMVGDLIRGIRKNVVVQTKVELGRQRGDESSVNVEAAARLTAKMEASLARSLKSLKSDYVDILLLHGVSSPEILRRQEVMAFLEKAKKSGQIRACGFSTHSNQAEMVKAAAAGKLYDVAMIAYNHKGAYVHASGNGQHGEWDKAALDAELERVRNSGFGIVAMKTCSGGPCQPADGSKPTIRGAIQWVIEHGHAHVSAVAMGNMEEVKDNLQLMREK
jgi:aryl-alcohol dehydrogenase-like predicted oxidoreductase